ncbi:MAG: hypothetical protein ABI939_02595 [Anaerolineaceae bacterium]
MSVITIGEGGMIRIPGEILERTHLKEGAPVSSHVSEDGEIVIQAEEPDPDQAWFWTQEWQRKEREADEDIAAGGVTGPMTDKGSWRSLSGSTARRVSGAQLLGNHDIFGNRTPLTKQCSPAHVANRALADRRRR